MATTTSLKEHKTKQEVRQLAGMEGIEEKLQTSGFAGTAMSREEKNTII